MKKLCILILSFFSMSLHASPHLNISLKNSGTPFLTLSPVTIFPNPTSGNISIKIELDKAVDVDITIYNAIGKIVFTDKTAGYQGAPYEIPILFEDQPTGVYFVHVKAGAIKSVERLIKIK